MPLNLVGGYVLQDIWFYQLPEHEEFYVDLLGMLEEGSSSLGESTYGSVRVLVSKFDALQLERTVGTSRARSLLKSSRSTFMFC